jgi:hypothetical protein
MEVDWDTRGTPKLAFPVGYEITLGSVLLALLHDHHILLWLDIFTIL